MTENGATNTSNRDLRQRYVLVVDDEKRIADTLTAILESKGYESRATYDGATALETCHARIPDLLITDVVMPGMSGIELGIAVKREYSTCRVLLFSGQAATAQMLQDAEARGHRFELLAKPVHPSVLLERVEQLIGAGVGSWPK
ncbi:MAG TPA: response regulator [Terriglobales bacterium]|nr:response regulator [Terriglobales bacterium]